MKNIGNYPDLISLIEHNQAEIPLLNRITNENYPTKFSIYLRDLNNIKYINLQNNQYVSNTLSNCESEYYKFVINYNTNNNYENLLIKKI